MGGGFPPSSQGVQWVGSHKVPFPADKHTSESHLNLVRHTDRNP